MYEEIKNRLAEDALAVENYLKKCYSGLNDTDTAAVREAELYSLLGGGKRIRPFLTIEFCRAFGGDVRSAMPFAAAVEMMHTFSLIHDDMPCMDDDDLRRGRLTSHKKFGEAAAMLAGDSLSLRALQTVLENPYVADREARLAACELARAAGSEGMIGGQIIDMRGETEKLGFNTLLKLHEKKTGAMIRVSAALGCIAAGLELTSEKAAAADKYASAVGLAFQIIDDILDATMDAESIGKSVGGDAEHNKTTFLSFMDIESAYKYASGLTSEAASAVADIDAEGILGGLAYYLLDRKK